MYYVLKRSLCSFNICKVSIVKRKKYIVNVSHCSEQPSSARKDNGLKKSETFLRHFSKFRLHNSAYTPLLTFVICAYCMSLVISSYESKVHAPFLNETVYCCVNHPVHKNG